MASIQKDKYGKWFCRVSYKENGKYKTKTRKGFSTKKEAQVVAAELELQAENGFKTQIEEIIFADYFEEWVEQYKIDTGLSPTTERKYLRTVKTVREFFGNTTLVNLTRLDYQKFLNSRGKNNGKDTVAKTHYYLRACIKLAIADGLITKDPTYNAQFNYDNEPSTKTKVWSEQEAKQLNQHFLNECEIKNVMLYIALNTGMRIGEVFALSRTDITKEVITIRDAYDYKYARDFTGGKNEQSIRTIQQPSNTLYRFVQEYKLQIQKVNSDYLFLDDSLSPLITYNGLRKHLKRVCAELDIPYYSIHPLRHTHASILLYQGMDIHYVSKRLGHSTIIETLKTYAHIIDEMKQREDEKLKVVMQAFELGAK